MKIAIITVTDSGARLAARTAEKLAGTVDLYIKVGREGGTDGNIYEHLGELIAAIYGKYNGLVFIMAAGIVVRLIAPHIRDKRFDPAVVVMDEAGSHAISLLSGHIGGANGLARTVAAAVGATPVITTATDVGHKPAADMLAARLRLEIEPFDQLKHINAAIVAGRKVVFFIDRCLPNVKYYVDRAAEEGVTLEPSTDLVHADRYDAAVVISDKEMYMVKPHIFLRPATLAVGVGCRQGVTSAALFTAVADACRKIGRSVKSVAVVGTSVVKEDEIGLLAMVEQMNVPLATYGNEELQRCIDTHRLDTAEFVEEKIGVGNVCEAAALLASGADKLLLAKTVYDKITVAIAEAKSPS
jgi:cobalt-precorrin 5A hydrolase